MSRADSPDAASGPGASGGTTSGRLRAWWPVIGVLIAIPIVLPLLVGTYSRTSPELAGVPFYFWWQFFLIIVSAVMTVLAYVLVLRLEAERHRRAAARGANERGDGDSGPGLFGPSGRGGDRR